MPRPSKRSLASKQNFGAAAAQECTEEVRNNNILDKYYEHVGGWVCLVYVLWNANSVDFIPAKMFLLQESDTYYFLCFSVNNSLFI